MKISDGRIGLKLTNEMRHKIVYNKSIKNIQMYTIEKQQQ